MTDGSTNAIEQAEEPILVGIDIVNQYVLHNVGCDFELHLTVTNETVRTFRARLGEHDVRRPIYQMTSFRRVLLEERDQRRR